MQKLLSFSSDDSDSEEFDEETDIDIDDDINKNDTNALSEYEKIRQNNIEDRKKKFNELELKDLASSQMDDDVPTPILGSGTDEEAIAFAFHAPAASGQGRSKR